VVTVKAFDVIDARINDPTLPGFGPIFIALATVNIVFSDIFPANNSWLARTPRTWRMFNLGTLLVCVICTVGAFMEIYPAYLRHKALVAQNGCRVVEGASPMCRSNIPNISSPAASTTRRPMAHRSAPPRANLL